MIGSHNSNIDRVFYNDRVKEIIAADIIAEPFTYVPIKSGHMELVGGNAVVFGKITEGYDVIEIDVATEITYQDVSLANPIINLSVVFEQLGPTNYAANPPQYVNTTEYFKGDAVWYIMMGSKFYFRCIQRTTGNVPSNTTYWKQTTWDTSASFRMILGRMVISIPNSITEGASYNITVENAEEGIASITASYTAQPGDLPWNVGQGLRTDCINKGFEDAAITPPSTPIEFYRLYFYPRHRYYMQTPVFEIGDAITNFSNFTVNAYILTLGLTIKYPQLKCGAVHAFGIVYKDRAGRTCSVIKNNALTVYIPYYSEEPNNLLQSVVKLIFKINHRPPLWAESYEIVYFGNISMDYFLQIRAYDITQILNSNGNRFSININETLVWAWNLNNRWKIPAYEWIAGDRLRLAGILNQTTYYGEAIGSGYVYDYEIEATGTQYNEEAIGGDWLIIQAVKRPTPFAGATNIIVEIYRPRKGLSQTVAYGTGMVFDIATDAQGNRFHKGDVDQDIINDTPAEVYNTAYDCWKFFRLNYKQTGTTQTGIIQPFWAESIFPSDWWRDQDINKKLTSMGFPFLDDLSQKQTILDERFRFGGAIIEGTRTNNIAHFTYLNYRDLQKKNGDITGLREVGFTLKTIQMYKETSVYINRVQTFNPDGTSQFTLTDSFIGDMRPMDDDYGCQHPDSIMVNGRNLYYWDQSQGKFIRSAPNGQTVLDIKMQRWFKDLVKWIQLSGGGTALETRTGANNEHDEIWVTFRMGTEVKGIVFNEKRGRFTFRINQITESYVHLGNFFAHLYHQRVWIMNIDEGQDYLTWVGVPTYAEIEVVSNIEPVRNKVYNAIALFADHELSSLPKYIYIPAEASAGNNLMESNVSIWDRVEGVFYGEILKDENSKGNFVSLNDRKMNGNAMRGRYCFVKLYTEEHDDKVRIDSIVIFSTPSERNV